MLHSIRTYYYILYLDIFLDFILFSRPLHLTDKLTTHFSVQYSYSWAVFLLFHVNFTLILHGMSIWYTLVLAVWRLIMIRHHTSAVTLCTPQRCYFMIILGYGESRLQGAENSIAIIYFCQVDSFSLQEDILELSFLIFCYPSTSFSSHSSGSVGGNLNLTGQHC